MNDNTHTSGMAPTAPAQPVAWRFRSFADGFWSDWSHVGYEPQGSTTDTFQKEPLFALGVPVVDEAQERIAFEAWCESRGRGHSTVLKFDNGDYRNETAREEWRGWLGRATHSSGVTGTQNDQGEQA